MHVIPIFKIAILMLSSFLFFLGGFRWLFCRRFIMPSLLSFSCCFLIHSLWPLIMLFSMLIFSLGYGDNSPLRHIFGNGWGRGVWGLLGALALSLGLLLTGHMAWYFFVPYLGLSFTLENALKNLNQKIGDPLIGLGFSCIIFLLH